MSEHDRSPTHEQVVEALRHLIDGTMTPEAASAWASRWAVDDQCVADSRVERAITRLAGADSPAPDRRYLFVEEDFEEWLRELIA